MRATNISFYWRAVQPQLFGTGLVSLRARPFRNRLGDIDDSAHTAPILS